MALDGSGTRPGSVEVIEQATIRFAGDSGDGMQVTGGQFTNTSALLGNDLATFPDYPAEIRAPAGTLPGVSGFQVRFSSVDIHTPGDNPDVLVAMNPAALKVNLKDLKPGGIVIVNTDAFEKADLLKAKCDTNPLDDGTLDSYRRVDVPLEKLTKEALKESGLDAKSVSRCKNMFALGICYWLYNRPLENTKAFLDDEFAKKKKRVDLAEANKKALQAGFNYADIAGLFNVTYEVPKAKLSPGTYRNIMGNQAVGLGLVAASKLSNLQMFLGSYPITPASDILHQVSGYKQYGVITMQCEDEIAAVCASIGAAYAGKLAVTTTSGPGLALKSEAINLAVMTELPLVVIDIQRGGPSTGLPTKTEQADLLQAMYGRNSDSPLPIVSCSSPADAFEATIEACRIAVKYMTPVMLLSDGYIANGSEPWKLPKVSDLKPINVKFHTDPATFKPYMRDPQTLARPWAIPGTKDLYHRIGGIEKQDVTGNVNYDPQNHEKMTRQRHAKVAGIAQDIPEFHVNGPQSGKLLVLGWGSTLGSILGAVERLAHDGMKVSHGHLRYLNPFPRGLAEALDRFETVLIPEMNCGQLAMLVQGKFAKKVVSYSKVQGRPFTTQEIVDKVRELMK